METYQAEVLVNERFHLSEGPVWDAETGVLHFVDIKGCTVNTYRLSDGQRTSTEVNHNVGCERETTRRAVLPRSSALARAFPPRPAGCAR